MNLYDDMQLAAAEANEQVFETAVSPAPLRPDAGQYDRIRLLAQDFSIEVLPKTASKINNFSEYLPLGTRVFIPFLPAGRFADCVPLAARLRREGMEPVPHIAARRLRSSAELSETLERLRAEAQVRKCLVIAGDPKTPAGPFRDSLAVLETGTVEASGIRTIFVGGQPEGISGVSPEAVDAALLAKLDYARSTSAELRLITQFTLDIQSLTSWLAKLDTLGDTLPIHVGIAGPTSLTTLLKFATLTGASASLRAMRRYGARLSQLATETAPDALVAHLAGQREALAGLHTYTFGGFARSAAWMTALSRADFDVGADGRFTIR
jgi:methylenetetrahydrofolate reductase (NADPH)